MRHREIKAQRLEYVRRALADFLSSSGVPRAYMAVVVHQNPQNQAENNVFEAVFELKEGFFAG
jgi:hypothetical protein